MLNRNSPCSRCHSGRCGCIRPYNFLHASGEAIPSLPAGLPCRRGSAARLESKKLHHPLRGPGPRGVSQTTHHRARLIVPVSRASLPAVQAGVERGRSGLPRHSRGMRAVSVPGPRNFASAGYVLPGNRVASWRRRARRSRWTRPRFLARERQVLTAGPHRPGS